MAETLGKAFDVSNWSGPFAAGGVVATGAVTTAPLVRPLSAARPQALAALHAAGTDEKPLTGSASCIRNEGYSLGIIGTQNAGISRAQMGACVEAEIHLQAYLYLYFNGDPVAQVDAALRACEGFPVERLWLDCEDSAASALTEAQTLDFIQRAADTCIDRMWSGIYTAGWWWRGQTGNSDRFRAYPLWNASADGVGDLTPVNYGGWSIPYMEQYRFDAPICGVNTDLNVYQLAVPEPPQPGPEPPPPKPEQGLRLLTYETDTTYQGFDAERGHVYVQTTRFGVWR